MSLDTKQGQRADYARPEGFYTGRSATEDGPRTNIDHVGHYTFGTAFCHIFTHPVIAILERMLDSGAFGRCAAVRYRLSLGDI